MGRKLQKTLILLLVTVLFTGMAAGIARADRGPKPNITLYVKNYPQGAYYVALLKANSAYAAGKETFRMDGPIDDKSVAEYLKDFSAGGYEYWDVNCRYKKGSGSGSFDFHYMAPAHFRVIIIELDGTVTVSESHSREYFNSECTLDFATGAITEKGNNARSDTGLYGGFFRNIILTVIIEIIVMLVFRYPFSGHNVAEVVFLNLVTNVYLQITLMACMPADYFRTLLIWEVIIFVVEGLIYGNDLRDKKDKTHFLKGVLYALAANLLSALSMLIPNL